MPGSRSVRTGSASLRPSPARRSRGRLRLAVRAGATGVAAGALACGSVTSAVAAAQPDGARSAPQHGAAAGYAHYVALGDSYASGAGIPEQTDQNCARSDRNYPTLVAAQLAPGSFTDVTCGGATTENMTGPQGTAPPQFDALTEDTDLVSVTIGGNDIGFGGIVARCVVLGALVPNGSPCKASYSLGGEDELAARIQEKAARIDEVLRGIHERSPDARVVVVGYPDLLPDDGTNCPETIPMAKGDTPWLRDTEKRLNGMLAERAAAGGAEYLDTYGPTVGHDMCKPQGTRWIEPLQAVDAAGVHPNALGHEAMAGALLGAVSTPARR